MIEASFQKGSEKREKVEEEDQSMVSQMIHDTIVTTLGDDDVRATDYEHKGAKVEPVLRIFPGSHHMCITNDDLDKGRGNGTLCRCLKVKLKKKAKRKWKNWEGHKVWVVSIDDVEWVQFKHWPHPPKNGSKTFTLTPHTFPTTIKIPLTKHTLQQPEM